MKKIVAKSFSRIAKISNNKRWFEFWMDASYNLNPFFG